MEENNAGGGLSPPLRVFIAANAYGWLRFRKNSHVFACDPPCAGTQLSEYYNITLEILIDIIPIIGYTMVRW